MSSFTHESVNRNTVCEYRFSDGICLKKGCLYLEIMKEQENDQGLVLRSQQIDQLLL